MEYFYQVDGEVVTIEFIDKPGMPDIIKRLLYVKERHNGGLGYTFIVSDHLHHPEELLCCRVTTTDAELLGGNDPIVIYVLKDAIKNNLFKKFTNRRE